MSEETESAGGIVDRHLFTALINLSDQTKKKTQAAAGELGERIKHAVENGNLNAWAFKVVAALNRQEEQKRRERINALRDYLEMAEEELWSGDHCGDLVDLASHRAGASDAAATDAGPALPPEVTDAKNADEAASAANAKAIESGIRPLTEAETATQKAARQRDEDAQAFDAKSPDDLLESNVTPLAGAKKSRGMPNRPAAVN